MRKLIRLFALITVLMLAGQTETFAQPFKSAIGLRLGSPVAVSFKTFLTETNAVEVYAGYRSFSANYSWFSINAAYQIHKDIDSVDGLQWYYGFGGGAFFWDYDFIDESSTTFNIAGYLGLQYTFADEPITITADWVPSFFFGDNYGADASGFGAGYGALSARYIFSR